MILGLPLLTFIPYVDAVVYTLEAGQSVRFILPDKLTIEQALAVVATMLWTSYV